MFPQPIYVPFGNASPPREGRFRPPGAFLIRPWYGKRVAGAPGVVEDLYGPREFLAIYLVSAVAGGLAFTLAPLAGLGASNSDCIGASGAVTAVLVLCACHFPNRIIYLFMFLPVPNWFFVIFSV